MFYGDRVKETITDTGLANPVNLLGAVTGFAPFSSVYILAEYLGYCIVDGNNWEVGYGTYGLGTITRDVILSSSNSGAMISLSGGVSTIFCTAPGNQITLPTSQYRIRGTKSLIVYLGMQLTTSGNIDLLNTSDITVLGNMAIL